LVGAGLFTPSSVDAQTDVRRELVRTPHGELLDFTPDGVWRRKVRELAALRAQLRGVPPGMVVAEGVFLPTVSGVLSVPAILFGFQDISTGSAFTAGDVEDRLFGASPPASLPYTIRTYYDQMSGGVFRIEGQVVGWLTLDGNEEDYTGVAGTCLGNPFGTLNCNGLFSVDASQRRVAALTEAIQKADPQIDFGDFDNDGPDGIPNSGDDDGVVDLIAFYHTEQDGSCGGASNNHFWAHRSSLGGVSTADPAAGGGVIRIRDYVMQSGVGGAGGCDVGSPVAIGTSAHEFGHGLGLPDFYDVAGPTEGIGHWGLMGSGNWRTQQSPARMTPWSLNELGWITVVSVTSNTSLTLPPITTSRTAYALRAADPNPRGEYLLLENRQGLLSDSAVIRAHCGTSGFVFPANCGGGLAIWHVDSSKIAGSMPINQVNSGSIHGLALVQADGNGDLDTPTNRGDAGDVWPGISGADTFDSLSTPSARKNGDGLWLGFDLTDITQDVPHGDVSLEVAFAPPNMLSVSPSHFSVSVTQGSVTPINATAAVELTGPGAGSIPWAATHGASGWLTVTTSAGIGPDDVTWTRDPTGVAAGTYVDTVTVTATGVPGSPALVIDTLVVVPPLVMTVDPLSRADTVIQGSTSPVGDSADVTFTGPGAASANWSAAHGGGTWLTITTSGGVSNGVVRWERDPSGLTAGSYVDTVTVTSAGAGGSPAMIIDTLTVLPPLTMDVSPSSRSVNVAEGSAAIVDSAAVTFSGSGAASAAWTAAHGSGSWFTLVDVAGTGDGAVRWTRDPTGLAVGVYVDTVTVTAPGATGSPATVVDSLTVVASLVLTVAPDSVSVSSVESGPAIPDSAAISLAGPGAANAPWSVAHSADWLALEDSTGMGPAVVRWLIDLAGLIPDVYTDTLVVSAPGASGSPAHIPVRLEVLQALTLQVSPSSTRDTVIQGTTTASNGTSAVQLTGAGSAQAQWTATHGASNWLSLNVGGGTGSGNVTWSRDPTGLGAGAFVDTITIAALGAVGSPARIIDTLVVLPPVNNLTLSVTPGSSSVSVNEGSTAMVGDSAAVSLAGPGAASAPWTAAHGGGAWLVLMTAAGTGSGPLYWQRDPSGLAAGVYVDTVVVQAAGALGSPARVIDTLVVSPVNTPLSVSLSPGQAHVLATSGDQTGIADSADVIITGTGADQLQWTATDTAPWSTFVVSTGVGGGKLRWTRDARTLVPGVYVNSIQVTAGAVAVSFADTLEVTPADFVVNDLITEILDGGVLAPVHRTYLDSLGNRDGIFNLGDLLAHLDREGVQLSAGQQRKLLRNREPRSDSPARREEER
jgi:M6 family metalloprotease-like protein